MPNNTWFNNTFDFLTKGNLTLQDLAAHPINFAVGLIILGAVIVGILVYKRKTRKKIEQQSAIQIAPDITQSSILSSSQPPISPPVTTPQQIYTPPQVLQVPQVQQVKPPKVTSQDLTLKRPYVSGLEKLIAYDRSWRIEEIGIIIAVAFFALFVMLYYLFPKYSLVISILGSTMFLPIGMFFGIFFRTESRVWLLRKFSGKNYGFVRFVEGKTIRRVIKNIDDDLIKIGDSIYIIRRDKIYNEKEPGNFKTITDKEIKFEAGVPTIHFDINDMLPLDFHPTPKGSQDSYRVPAQAGATLNKEIAVEKAKAVSSVGKKLNMAMIVIISCLILIVYFVYSNYNWLETGFRGGFPVKGTIDVNALKQAFSEVCQNTTHP